MIQNSLSSKSREVIFQEAIHRDLLTARRALLLDLLWNERFLTRSQLIARINQKLGKIALENRPGRIIFIETCAL
jgi:hypothetical protein